MKIINLGRVKVGQKKRFEIVEDTISFKDVVSTKSCGCFSKKINTEKEVLEVVYTIQKIPYHFDQSEPFHSSKNIVLLFKNGSTFVITIKCTVTNE